MVESSADRLARLLTLVPWLAAHSGISKADAARHFGLTPAQLEADLELITVTGPGLYGGELVDIAFEDETITVYDHQGLNRPLELSADEAAALIVGLHALQQLPDIDAALVARVIDKLSAYSGAGAEVDVRVQSNAFAAVIRRALDSGHDLDITYIHPLRDDATERVVTPISVITRDGVDYLNGWCHLAGAIRTFRLDRMQTCSVGEPTGEPPIQSGDDTTPSSAVIAVPASEEHLLERISATILERGAELRVRVEYVDPEWLVRWAVSAGGRVRVIEPVHLRDAVVERARRALAAYAALD